MVSVYFVFLKHFLCLFSIWGLISLSGVFKKISAGALVLDQFTLAADTIFSPHTVIGVKSDPKTLKTTNY